MTRSIALVLSILAFPAVLSAQEKGPFKLTWGVSPADVVVFGVQPGGGDQGDGLDSGAGPRLGRRRRPWPLRQARLRRRRTCNDEAVPLSFG